MNSPSDGLPGFARDQHATLWFNGFRFRVLLGCRADERAAPQPVSVAAAIRFPRSPGACESDDLEDTVCYAALAEAMVKRCHGREFRLIERLSRELYDVVRALVPPDSLIRLTVTKLNPPVDSYREGVSFSLSDY